MAIIITRGTTKTIYFTLDCCNQEWSNLGNIHTRLVQGNVVIDKDVVIDENDPTLARVDYTQEETLRLKDGLKAEFQLFPVSGVGESEVAIKSGIYEVNVLKSLWNEVVHNE